MAQRPRLDLEASYFVDAYEADIECLRLHKQLITEVLDVECRTEEQLTRNINGYVEKKYAKLLDHFMGKWEYREDELNDKIKAKMYTEGLADSPRTKQSRASLGSPTPDLME